MFSLAEAFAGSSGSGAWNPGAAVDAVVIGGGGGGSSSSSVGPGSQLSSIFMFKCVRLGAVGGSPPVSATAKLPNSTRRSIVDRRGTERDDQPLAANPGWLRLLLTIRTSRTGARRRTTVNPPNRNACLTRRRLHRLLESLPHQNDCSGDIQWWVMACIRPDQY